MRNLPDDFLQELFDEMETGAQAYAKAAALAEGLREDRKVTKNMLMLVAEAEGTHTITKQERFAYTHPSYRIIIDQLKGAIEAEALTRYKMKMFELRFEAWRSLNSNARIATR